MQGVGRGADGGGTITLGESADAELYDGIVIRVCGWIFKRVHISVRYGSPLGQLYLNAIC